MSLAILTAGIDLAKRILAVIGIHETGLAARSRQEGLASLPPGLVVRAA